MGHITALLREFRAREAGARGDLERAQERLAKLEVKSARLCADPLGGAGGVRLWCLALHGPHPIDRGSLVHTFGVVRSFLGLDLGAESAAGVKS